MCGIVALLNLDPSQAPHGDLRRQAIAQAKKIRHRGPDWSGVYADDRAMLVHERLSIVDVEHGAQPLLNARTGAALAVNGEIYNHRQLRAALKSDHAFQTTLIAR